MPRKLPWAQNGQTTRPAQHRQKTPEPEHANTADQDLSDGGRSKKANIKRRQRSRSRSTSPPPQPPSIEPMREGFEDDDIWMIVEDEFEALAKTFMAHLHHAEYKKLVKRARDAPPKPLPTPASPMSKETMRRIQRDNLRHKQQEALDGIGAGSGSRTPEDNVEDAWRGTSIAGLIASGSQEKRSLKGIDRLPSSTRAAQGFARPGSSDGVPKDTEPVPPRKRPRDGEPAEIESPKSTKSATASKPVPVSQSGSAPSSRRPGQSVPKGWISSDPSMPTKGDAKATVNRLPISSLLAKRKKVNRKESREERLSQVPMFLI